MKSLKRLIGLVLLIAIAAFAYVKFTGTGSGNSKLSEAEINRLNTNLSIITSSPGVSSNPTDYIKAHQKEYDEIIKMGKPAVNYLIDEFKKGNLNGSNEWIAAWICNEILGDKNPIKIWAQDSKNGWSTGRDWFEKYETQRSYSYGNNLMHTHSCL